MIGYIIVGIVVLLFWIWGLIDIIRADNSEYTVISGSNAKIIWLIIVLIFPLIGTLIYAILEKRLFLRPGFSFRKSAREGSERTKEIIG